MTGDSYAKNSPNPPEPICLLPDENFIFTKKEDLHGIITIQIFFITAKAIRSCIILCCRYGAAAQEIRKSPVLILRVRTKTSMAARPQGSPAREGEPQLSATQHHSATASKHHSPFQIKSHHKPGYDVGHSGKGRRQQRIGQLRPHMGKQVRTHGHGRQDRRIRNRRTVIPENTA